MKHITRIVTQCADNHGGDAVCVSSYYLKVKDDADDAWTDVCGTDSCPQLFTGNDNANDMNALVTNVFDWPIAARFVRLDPWRYIAWIGLRWELYGCE